MKEKKKISTSTKSQTKNKISLFDKWNKKIESISENKLLVIFLLLTLIFDFLNFNFKISEAHDDALYIEAAYRFINEFPKYFYTANAPLYPMFLALLMKIFGFNIFIFKLFNVFFHIGTVFFAFKTFKGIIPNVFFVFLMLFLSMNHLMIYFSSMTFTEQMYMFIQFGMVYYLSRVLVISDKLDEKKSIQNILLLSFFVFLLNITRNISISVVPAIVIFLYLIKPYRKKILYFLAFYGIFQIIFRIVVKLIWKDAITNQYSSQSKILLQKDPYDASLGYDDFWGFVDRFFGNTELYFSKRFFQILGLKSEDNTSTNMLIPLIMWAALILGTIIAFRNRKYLIGFLGVYSIALLGSTFFVLQTRWDQPRFVLVGMPFMFIVYFYLFEKFLRSNFWKFISFVIVLVLSVSIILSTIKRTITNLPITLKNFQGDIYYGYTPDWQNFLKASEWCGKNLPPNAYVASRKAPMSFIYGKRKFFPIYSVIKKDENTNQSNPDSALAFFKQNGVTHILMPRLRIDPTKNTGQYINTIDNILEPILKKYPQKLKLIHTEREIEPCYVFEFKYDE